MAYRFLYSTSESMLLLLFFCSNVFCMAKLIIQPSDHVFQYVGSLPKKTYHTYCKNIYSQNGEDGILEQLIKELHISAGTFCEFGASDGITSSNTYNLIKNYNFSGIAIELDRVRYERCVSNYQPFPNVQIFNGAVMYNDPHNDLNAWLKKGSLSYDFDILSIDIDYDDYYVWERLTDFMPKIVILETNSYRDPVYDELPGVVCQAYNKDLLQEWNKPRVAQGCSFMAAIKLGLQKGYIPVAYTGNITFVRKDLVYKLQDFPYLVSDNPYDYLKLYSHLVLWNNTWMTNTGLILNVAIRDYYMTYHRAHIDIDWLNVRIQEIVNNKQVIF